MLQIILARGELHVLSLLKCTMDTDNVLALNNSCEPLLVCIARRAIVLLYPGKAKRIEGGLSSIRSSSIGTVIFAVICLHRYVKRPAVAAVSFHKKNILPEAEIHIDQCCGRDSGKRMTTDCVIPKSSSGRTVWKNVVSACRVRMLKKRSTPFREARMGLRRKHTRGRCLVVSPNIMSRPPHGITSWSKHLLHGIGGVLPGSHP